MKTLLALLFLVPLTTYAQGTWPRNPKTGKVEFRGSLPWPASAKTEAQRQALVRRWYLAKLTDSSPTEVEAQAATNHTNGLLTYAKLPKVTGIQAGKGNDKYLLSYTVSLSALSNSITYQLSGLNLSKVSEDELMPIEEALAANSPNEKAALAALRKRLAVALAGW